MKFTVAIKNFLDYLEVEKNRTVRTRENYHFYLKRLYLFLSNSLTHEPDTNDLDQETVREYRLWLNRDATLREEPLKKVTQNYHLIALRSFLKYLSKQDIPALAPEKIELARTPERQVSFLEQHDLSRMLDAPLGLKGDDAAAVPLVRARDKAILELFFSTGLRVAELAKLKREDVNLKRVEFTVRGKGGKLRVVFLSEQARHWLKLYLDKRSDVEPWLFVRHDRAAGRSTTAGSLTPRSIERLVAFYARAAGITKKVSPHTLRHSYATDLLRNGADLRSVQELLGHSSVTTTQIYTHVTNQQLREVFDAFHGRTRKSD